MGLEIAEIMMDLEDEFFVVLESDARLDGSVKSLEDFVLSAFSRQRIADLIDVIGALPYGDNAVLDRSQYKITRQHVPALPRGLIWVPGEFNTKEKIIQSLRDRLSGYPDDESVRVGVRRIIEKRLQLKVQVKPSDHLVRDLNAG